jgi:hypothetical protein
MAMAWGGRHGRCNGRGGGVGCGIEGGRSDAERSDAERRDGGEE